MITKGQYIEYLISTPANYTCANLAEHLEGVSHDAVSDYLAHAKSTARQLWELVQPLLNDKEEAYLIVDDSAQDKRYSKQIELVRMQYSGAEGGLVDNLKLVVRLGLVFVSTLKNNRLVSLSKEDGYIHCL